jgi:hypothetical protein
MATSGASKLLHGGGEDRVDRLCGTPCTSIAVAAPAKIFHLEKITVHERIDAITSRIMIDMGNGPAEAIMC